MDRKFIDYVVASGRTKETLVSIRTELANAAAALMTASLNNNQVAIGTSVASVLRAANEILALTGNEQSLTELVEMAQTKNKDNKQTN